MTQEFNIGDLVLHKTSIFAIGVIWGIKPDGRCVVAWFDKTTGANHDQEWSYSNDYLIPCHERLLEQVHPVTRQKLLSVTLNYSNTGQAPTLEERICRKIKQLDNNWKQSQLKKGNVCAF